MYSLDQVIRFLEQKQQTEDWNIRDEAIAYLKGYREILPEYSQMKLNAVNAPLTWEELKQMEGKPVWVEGSHGCIYDHKSWALISFDKNDDMKCQLYDSCEFWIGKEDYGTDWNAYRKEKRTS